MFATNWGDRFLSVFTDPKRGKHVAGLDVIRGIAVAFIVLYHCWALSGAPVLALSIAGLTIFFDHFISGMGLGVDIFFVLSGFLLSLPWHRAYYAHQQYPAFGTYINRRLLRIVPPYWFMLFIILLLLTNSAIYWTNVVSQQGALTVVAHLFFAQQLLPVTSTSFGVNGALWTLTIEMMFYLTLPLLVLVFVGKRWVLALPISLAVSLGYLYLSRYSLNSVEQLYQGTVAQYNVPEASIRSFMSHQFFAFPVEFGIGMTLANFWERRNGAAGWWIQWLRSPVACWLFLAAGVLLLLFSIDHVWEDGVYYYTSGPTAATAAGLLILGCQNTTVLGQWIYRNTVLRWIGVIGYTVFLWHFPLISLVENYPIVAPLSPLARFGLVTAIVVPAVLLLGSVLFLLVEKPFIERRKPLVMATPNSSLASDRVEPRAPAEVSTVRMPGVEVVPTLLVPITTQVRVVRDVTGSSQPDAS